MQISAALAPPCEEKARLLRLASVAEANHHRAIQELTWRVGALKDPNFKVLQDLAEGVRKLVDDAQEALNRHTSAHGCQNRCSVGIGRIPITKASLRQSPPWLVLWGSEPQPAFVPPVFAQPLF